MWLVNQGLASETLPLVRPPVLYKYQCLFSDGGLCTQATPTPDTLPSDFSPYPHLQSLFVEYISWVVRLLSNSSSGMSRSPTLVAALGSTVSEERCDPPVWNTVGPYLKARKTNQGESHWRTWRSTRGSKEVDWRTASPIYRPLWSTRPQPSCTIP